jgi:hypothetical protein
MVRIWDCRWTRPIQQMTHDAPQSRPVPCRQRSDCSRTLTANPGWPLMLQCSLHGSSSTARSSTSPCGTRLPADERQLLDLTIRSPVYNGTIQLTRLCSTPLMRRQKYFSCGRIESLELADASLFRSSFSRPCSINCLQGCAAAPFAQLCALEDQLKARPKRMHARSSK